MWQKVVERFEERAPGAVMAHLAVDITADYGTLTRLLPPEY